MSNQKFNRQLAKLNPAQRQAVETIEGPLMVIAGPGTGKTQVVAMRIANILAQTQLAARNILALTFTEAGVTALRERLVTSIGTDAYQVTISTFHGFANDIITTFPYIFGFTTEAMNVTELERLQIIHDIVQDGSYEQLRPLRSPTFHVPAIGRAIRSCKQEAVDPDTLIQLAKAQFELTKNSQLTEAKRTSAERSLSINLELADVYRQYQAQLLTRHLYDYEDMILFAINGLKENAEVRAYYQERFQYLLVDEYQDTNNAQNALVETLANFFDNPNLFVVGDDKQAIYRFQGASVANMLHFANKYPKMKIISLKENYRSRPPILAAASDLISHNTHQLATYLPKQSVAITPTRSADTCTVELRSFADEDVHFQWIIKKIQAMHQHGQPLEQIAVLFRRNESVREFRQAALKLELPIAGTESANLITEPEIQQLLSLLQAIDNPADRYKVVPTLRLIKKIPVFTLAELARLMANERLTLPVALAQLSADAAEKTLLKAATDQLLDWSSQAKELSVSELIERVLCDSLLLKEAGLKANAIERLELFKAFIDQARRFTSQQPSGRLGDFLSYITLLKNYQLRLPIHRLAPLAAGVFVATVHGAKGLEFDSVFLPDVSTKYWNDRASREFIHLPPGIVSLTDWQEDTAEEERRLLYVALTRARNQIFASFTATDDSGNGLLASQFIAEIASHFDVKPVTTTAEQAKTVLTTALSPIPGSMIRQQEWQYLKEVVTNSPFSFTAYQAFKTCPKQYLLNCVLRYPMPPDFGFIYGSIIHRALELYFKQYRRTKAKPELETLLKFFDQAWQTSWPIEGRTLMKTRGEALLTAYYQRFHQGWLMPVGVEYDLANHRIMVDDIWLTGKFDRLDPLDPVARTVRVVDYKTGSSSKTRGQIEGTTKDSDGRYKQQLVFYALLGRHDHHFPYRMQEFALSFIDDKQTFKQEVFTIRPEEIDALEKDVVKTYRELLTLKVFEHTRDSFDQGCEVCELFQELL